MTSRPKAGGNDALIKEDPWPPLNLILMGGPGCGKGTLCKAICEKFGVVHISVGDILRKRQEDGSEIGQQVRHQHGMSPNERHALHPGLGKCFPSTSPLLLLIFRP